MLLRWFCAGFYALSLISATNPAYANKNLASSKGISLSQVAHRGDTYILGPGDGLLIEVLGVSEYSGIYQIGPDGSLYLPRIRSIQAEGLTVTELKLLLSREFDEYVINPEVYVTIANYRPIRVYIGGEVHRPGYYYLSGSSKLLLNQEKYFTPDRQSGSAGSAATGRFSIDRSSFNNNKMLSDQYLAVQGGPAPEFIIPTLFDALRIAGGVTPFSNLTDVTVVRKQPLSEGGGKKKANLNFLSMLTTGDESQNIKLFDGDTVFVSKSSIEMREQIIKAGQTNLSPDFLQVFVSGRVRYPGPQTLPQGASLEQAIAASGGTKFLRGSIEFIRFNRDGTTDKRKLYSIGEKPAGTYSNPILMPGDVIRVNDSPLTAVSDVLGELTAPALGVYSVYSLYDSFQE